MGSRLADKYFALSLLSKPSFPRQSFKKNPGKIKTGYSKGRVREKELRENIKKEKKTRTQNMTGQENESK